MRQFYLSINNELIEAAEIDGANHLYIWSHLMLPLTKPALITIAINSFNAAWNDFLGPLLYIKIKKNTRYRLACKFSEPSNDTMELSDGRSNTCLDPDDFAVLLHNVISLKGWI